MLGQRIEDWAAYPEGTPNEFIREDRQRKERLFLTWGFRVVLLAGIALLTIATMGAL